MDYQRFVELRSPLWQDFESRAEAAERRLSRLGYEELEALALLYRQVLHDHALAATRFPRTEVAMRLARLSLSGTRLLLREGDERRGTLGRFFRQTFPGTVRRQRPALLLAVGLFLGCTLLGLALAMAAPSFGTVFLGPDAVRGMEEGHLWTEKLTSTLPPAVSSSAIATNNLSVALTGWAGGALAGLGSLYVLFLNGLMLGSVVGITLHFSLTPELLEFVAAHGPLELTVIVVSAASGLVLAQGLIAAEDRPRVEVLREASRESLVLLAGCLPWLVVLAAVEAYVSPSTRVPIELKLGLGLALEALFLAAAFGPYAPSKEAR